MSDNNEVLAQNESITLDTVLDEINKLSQDVEKVKNVLTEIQIKMSMNNGIMRVRNSLFWLPNFPHDIIQKYIGLTCNYWDIGALEKIDKYLKDGATILDLGANIGNHSLYWANERHARKIYSFEPVFATFSILKSNIELNNLKKVIKPYNVGLYDKALKASIQTFNTSNIGGTTLKADENGQMKLVALDSVKIKDKIDLIKIDVEGAEVMTLKGAVETIKRNKPVIVIETFENKQEVDNILGNLGYKLTDIIRDGEDYIYTLEE